MIDFPKLSYSKAAAEKCKRHLSFFVREFWDIIIQDPLTWNWHMEVLCDEVQQVYERVIKREPKEYDLIINIPPGTSKSTICTVMAPIWSWCRDDSLRHITGSYSDSLSTEHAVKARDIVRHEKFKEYFPNVQIKRDEDGKTNYKTTNGGQRFATSVGGTVTGAHAHILTFDDPLNPKQAASEVELKNANDFFDFTLSTRKVDKAITPLILIMQRLSVNDPTGHLLSKGKKNIRQICLPATLSDNVKPAEYKKFYTNGLLDETRMPLSVLNEMKIDLGSDGYAGQMDQEPVAPGGVILKKNWFEIVDKTIPADAVRNYQLDTAYTKNQANDPTAIVHYYREGEFIYITGKQSVWMELPALLEWLPSYVRNNGYTDKSMIGVEPKASGLSVVQSLRTGTSLNIRESEAPDKDKITRVSIVSPKIESGRVKLHRGDWNESFISQCCSFPKAPHDDELDCLVEIVRKELIKPLSQWVMMDLD